MDGMHDLGGRQGFGRVEAEPGEPPFHEPWEGRVHGMSETADVGPGFRHAIERMDPIGDWWEELAEHTSNAHALAPWRPAMRRIRRVPCPRCGETNLGIFGGESDITCLSCRAMMTEDQFELWQTVLRMEADEEDAG